MTKAELQAALDRADAELTQYLGWKLSAQLESKQAEAADEMCLKAIARAEAAEAKLAQIPWAALRVIAEREKWMLPQSEEDRTFLAWLEAQP